MPIPNSKTELIKAITKNYGALKVQLNKIDRSKADQKILLGHVQNTLITPKDLVAYLIGWGELVIKWNTKTSLNELVDWPETGYKWNQLGLLAQKFYQDYENLSYEERLSKLDKTVTTILELIDTKSDYELYDIPWYKKYTLGRMIQLNTSSPYQNAIKKLKSYQKQQLK
jgi:hypothetical protein